MKQNKREIPQEFKPARQHDENSSIGFTKDHTVVTYVPKKNKSLSSFHHSIMIQQSAAIQESLKSLNCIIKQKVQ
jgi:hypothetical protein